MYSFGREYLYKRKHWLWYGYIEPVVSTLLFLGVAMIVAAILGAMVVFGAAGGMSVIGYFMFG